MKIILSLLLSVFLIIPCVSYAEVYSFDALTGGCSTCLDGYNSKDLKTGDIAIGMYDSNLVVFSYDSTSTSSESTPSYIVPDNVVEDVRLTGAWVLKNNKIANSPEISGNLTHTGNTTQTGDFNITGDINQTGNQTITGNVSIGGAWSNTVNGFNVLNPVKASLYAGRSVAITCIGDSTGDHITPTSTANEWPRLLADWFAEQYSTYRVEIHGYNLASDLYDLPTVVQTGTSGERYIQLADTGASMVPSAMSLPSADFEIIAKIQFDTVTTPLDDTATIFARYGGAGARLFRWIFLASGQCRFNWTEDGSTERIASFNGAIATFSVDTTYFIKVKVDVDNGSGGVDVGLWYSADVDPLSWTQIGVDSTVAGGTMSMYSGAGIDNQDWTIGGSGITGNVINDIFPGRIYELRVNHAWNGYPTNPLNIEAWGLADGATTAYGGSPEINIINGHVAGADAEDFYTNGGVVATTDPMERVAMNYSPLMTLINLGHNYGNRTGRTVLATYEQLITDYTAIIPDSQIAFIAQNPRCLDASFIDAHAIRQMELIAWSSVNNYPLINVYQHFIDYGDYESDLYDVGDGVHPAVGDGREWFFDGIKRVFQ
jgi:hypothetical protein